MQDVSGLKAAIRKLRIEKRVSILELEEFFKIRMIFPEPRNAANTNKAILDGMYEIQEVDNGGL